MAKSVTDQLAERVKKNQEAHSGKKQDTRLEFGRDLQSIDIGLIKPNPYQPRTVFNEKELESLKLSIQESGLLQPIVVRPKGAGYEIIAGERRFRAHQNLGAHKIEAFVKPMSDADMAASALAENIQRADLSDYEICKAIQRIEADFPTKTALAESLGMIREDMYRFLAFNSLPEAAKAKLEQNPRLISKTSAVAIKTELNKDHYKAEERRKLVEQALIDALDLVERKRLDQLKVVDHIRRILEGQGRAGGSQPLKRDGKAIGSFKSDEKTLTLKLNTKGLSDSEIAEISALVQRLFPESFAR